MGGRATASNGRPRPGRSRRSVVLVGPALAALLAAAWAGALGGEPTSRAASAGPDRSASGPPSPAASTSPSPAPSPTPGFQAPLAWERATFASLPSGMELLDVIAADEGFIAVGAGRPDASGAQRAEIWLSEDGRAWRRAGLPIEASAGRIEAVTRLADGYLAVGSQCCPERAATWHSPDGDRWERLPDQPALVGGVMLDVTTSGSSVVALGCRVPGCEEGLAWRSSEGASWDAPGVLAWLPSAVTATTRGGLIGVGYERADGGHPVVATSADGMAWEPVALASVVGGLDAVVATSQGLLASGTAVDPDSGDVHGLLFASDDARTWDPLAGVGVAGSSFADLAWVGADGGAGSGDAGSRAEGGLLLAGSQVTPSDRVPATWWSVDGKTWEAGRFERELKGTGAITGVAVGADGTVVAVGSSVLNRGLVPAAWWATRD